MLKTPDLSELTDFQLERYYKDLSLRIQSIKSQKNTLTLSEASMFDTVVHFSSRMNEFKHLLQSYADDRVKVKVELNVRKEKTPMRPTSPLRKT